MPESSVDARYSEAAKEYEAGLCCPVEYDPSFLSVIPSEVLERDYGCGDPTQLVRPGDTVLDLGSGGGKVCFIVAQIVGAKGRSIGVDANDDMLALANNALPSVVEKLGYNNIEFRKGRIEDLTLDRVWLDDYLKKNPVTTEQDFLTLQSEIAKQGTERPLVAANSVDVVISNCVLNLVRHDKKLDVMQEVYRVLRRGGRVIISDIVSDEDVPEEMQRDELLWSDCVSGAIREDRWLASFAEAGLYGVTVVKRDEEPWKVINGIEFRSVTVAAYKGKEGACWDHHQAVIYKGPFKRVEDDDDHIFERGMRMAVCEKTFNILRREPYLENFEFIEPNIPVKASEARPFDCSTPLLRSPEETKYGRKPGITAEAAAPAVSDSSSNLADSKESVKVKKVYIFEQACCGPSPSQGLVDFLHKKFAGDIELELFNMGNVKGALPMPKELMVKIQNEGAGCLPAIVVDNVVVSEGRVPNFLEAVEMVQTGKPSANPRPAPAPAQSSSSGCCG